MTRRAFDVQFKLIFFKINYRPHGSLEEDVHKLQYIFNCGCLGTWWTLKINNKNKTYNNIFFLRTKSVTQRDLFLVPRLRRLRGTGGSGDKYVQSFAKYDPFPTRN